jgi:hypothetical protein
MAERFTLALLIACQEWLLVQAAPTTRQRYE